RGQPRRPRPRPAGPRRSLCLRADPAHGERGADQERARRARADAPRPLRDPRGGRRHGRYGGRGLIPPTMLDTAPAVTVIDLVKSYGEVDAVRGIDFEVRRGEIFGFLGPNGAGKSTTINMLCTLVRPTGGEARVADHDVVTERDAVRRNIGLVFQDTTLD